MTRDEDTAENNGGSLAEQAASWVPPWSRPAEERPVAEQDWDWDDPESSDTIDIAAELASAEELKSAEEPVEQVAPEPVVEPVAVVEPVVAAEPVVAEPVAPVEPEPVAVVDPGSLEPFEPLPPDEPLIPAEPLEPAEPLPPLEPVIPAEPAEPVEPPLPDVPLAALSEVELKGALEAILLVVDEPVGDIMLAQIIEQPTALITATLRELAAEYDEEQRGFELRSVAGGWRFYTRTTYAPYVERFVLDGQQVRLTQAALETLAVIAYKQPVTRSRISAIRGVNCDGVVRTLLSRGLIEECGSEPDSGAHLYRTTLLFLEKLGLNSVDELPPLAPFLPDDVEALADAT